LLLKVIASLLPLFVFDDAAKKRVAESLVTIGCMSEQIAQEKK